MRKRLSIVVLVASITLLCACGLGLAACGSGDTSKADKEAITKILQENVKSFEEGRAEIADQLAADESMASLFSLVGLDVKDYANAIADKMALEAGEVEVNGDKATADLKMTVPDYNALGSSMNAVLEESTANLDTSNMSEEELYAKVGEALMSATADVPTKTETVKVEFAKSGSEWKIQNQDEIEKAMSAAYSYSTE